MIYFKRVGESLIEPFRIGLDGVALSNFQIADHSMLFWSGKEESFLILNHIVGFFESMLGLKMNRSKCQILGIVSDQDKMRRWAEVFGREIGSFPSSHLDLFLGGNLRATFFWDLSLRRSEKG